MSYASFKSVESEEILSPRMPAAKAMRAQGLIAWSSLFFVLLQSICSFFVALDGLRVVIGVGALAGITQAGMTWNKVHTDWIRVPMIAFALVGALLNLAILRRARYLRRRPSSLWRQRPLTLRKIRMERVQLVLSLVTLALIAIEELTHFHTFHRM
ncbi:hypothetical protein [Tunturibacter empetritectus]|uniref:Uncharacterized protein n=1 Tax=Tunturiibacter lichenicola TaxID=2051959 RepID=A0A7W8J3W0_9BACT|nr:hypothetical protein [Edaphobacter lichenicola]MBB5342128.1 hypothetical protein [Edaphobacter lichenicola]